MFDLVCSLLVLSDMSNLLGYIGPGMGGGVIAAIFGIIAAFFLGLWGILYYPIKRFLKNKKRKIPNDVKNKKYKK